MDFVGGEAIYQVTTDESMQKVRKDLAKSPGTKRVLVRPTVTPEVMDLSRDNVLEIIELKDLLKSFHSMAPGSRHTRSKQARHLQEVLEIALEEFRRENRAETAGSLLKERPEDFWRSLLCGAVQNVRRASGSSTCTRP